jgi:uncharacterized protein with HEPN domain
METNQRGRLRDVLRAAELIASYVDGVAETDFRARTEKQDAVVRRLETIGEVGCFLRRHLVARLRDAGN